MYSSIRTCISKSPSEPLNIVESYAALLNYLWAKQNNGQFFIRIEDADYANSLDNEKIQAIKDLEWLGIKADSKPHLQSNRLDFYNEKLETLINGCKAYRCFCPDNQNDEKAGYSRACLNLSAEKIKAKLAANQSFVWKLKVETPVITKAQDHVSKKLLFTQLTFDDFAITNSDGTFTKIFMDFVDDWTARISHKFVSSEKINDIRQMEELHRAFLVEKPKMYVAPEIVTTCGVPVSKKDFGFYIKDLRMSGYQPQAILDFLSGSGSLSNPLTGQKCQNITDKLTELIKNFSFRQLKPNDKLIL